MKKQEIKIVLTLGTGKNARVEEKVIKLENVKHPTLQEQAKELMIDELREFTRHIMNVNGVEGHFNAIDLEEERLKQLAIDEAEFAKRELEREKAQKEDAEKLEKLKGALNIVHANSSKDFVVKDGETYKLFIDNKVIYEADFIWLYADGNFKALSRDNKAVVIFTKKAGSGYTLKSRLITLQDLISMENCK